MEQAAERTLPDLQVTSVHNIRQPVGSLSGGQRQAIAVAKAADRIAVLYLGHLVTDRPEQPDPGT